MNVGTVMRVDLRQAVVLAPDGGEVVCHVRARLMDRNKRLRGALVAGDEVEWEEDEEQPAIENVLPRRNAFTRRGGGGEEREHVIAANLDEVVTVVSLAQPPLRQGLLDRMAVAAAAAGLPVRIAFTKADLASPAEAERPAALYRGIGYPVHVVAASEGRGVEELRQALRGRRALFVGHSGVGKSTLLNAIEPSLGLRISEVNPVTGKGRHTTTAALLVRLADGTEIVDTPGFRSFAPWNLSPEQVAAAFPELRERLGQCRFRDCAHGAEPACAVRQALEHGDIDADRFEAYRKLRDEAEQENVR